MLQTLHEGLNEVAGHELRLRAQCHPDTTVAYRLDDHFVLFNQLGSTNATNIVDERGASCR